MIPFFAKNNCIITDYQKDEVIQFADATGDSLKLAQLSAENKDAEYIVFCGVHFMAETADILTNENQKVQSSRGATILQENNWELLNLQSIRALFGPAATSRLQQPGPPETSCWKQSKFSRQACCLHNMFHEFPC